MFARNMICCAVVLLGVLGPGCEEKKADAPDAAAVKASASPASAAPEQTEEDFEEEAATTITPDNLEAELSKLEAEIK